MASDPGQWISHSFEMGSGGILLCSRTSWPYLDEDSPLLKVVDHPFPTPLLGKTGKKDSADSQDPMVTENNVWGGRGLY